MDNMLRICVPLLLLCFAHLASSEQSSQDSPFSTGVRVLLNSYSACRNDREPINCLKFKFLRLADRMLNTSSVSIIDEEKPLFDPSLDEDARESEIDSLIWHRLRAIIKSKSIQLNMPKMLEKTKQLIGLGEEEEEEGTVADA
ncbi:hypothetical protein M8J75_003739 [Diaphorina citri]|nr:hypothetical protein M8J75_003739 [Diaphorina citri]